MKKVIIFVLVFISIFNLSILDVRADSNIQVGDILTYGKNTSFTEMFNNAETDIDNMMYTYLDQYATSSERVNYELRGELNIFWNIEFYIDNSTESYAIDNKVYINKIGLLFKRITTGEINFNIRTYVDTQVHGLEYKADMLGRAWYETSTENPRKSISYSPKSFSINETNLYITGGTDLANPLLNELLNLITMKSEIVNVITFETNGGNPIPQLSGSMTIPELPTPTRDNDIFTGWFYDKNLTNPVLQNQVINGDITIYARWITSDKIPNLNDKANDDGYEAGKDAGLIDGENTGYTYGYEDGYSSGYNEGKIDGADKDIELLEDNAYHGGYYEAQEAFAYERDGKYLDYNQAYQLGSGESDKIKEIVTPLIIFMLFSTVIFGAIKIVGGKRE